MKQKVKFNLKLNKKKNVKAIEMICNNKTDFLQNSFFLKFKQNDSKQITTLLQADAYLFKVNKRKTVCCHVMHAFQSEPT